MVSQENIRAIGQLLNDKKRPLKERFRALFTLKNIGGIDAIEELNSTFNDESVLLKHEVAYCLGQMQYEEAVTVLTRVLEDAAQEPMVRHEAAEALGAIGSPNVISILEKYRSDPVVDVAETCTIALDRVKWLQSGEILYNNNPYASIDPSPPFDSNRSIQEIEEIYMSPHYSLFDRYRALFSLRNMRSKQTALIIAKGLKDPSALFRHEVAFVLGQLKEKCSVLFLRENLEDLHENEMVRHECAEALGSIATDECHTLLKRYVTDENRVVRESCEIALDMCDYENSPEFQYANSLVNLSK